MQSNNPNRTKWPRRATRDPRPKDTTQRRSVTICLPFFSSSGFTRLIPVVFMKTFGCL